MMVRLIDSPMPSPSRLVVWKGSKTQSRSSALTPVPRSRTATFTIPRRAHAHLALVPRTVFHRIERVHEQIEHDLLQLDPVAQHRRHAGIDFDRDPAVTQEGVAVDEPDDVTDDAPQVERRVVRRL